MFRNAKKKMKITKISRKAATKILPLNRCTRPRHNKSAQTFRMIKPSRAKLTQSNLCSIWCHSLLWWSNTSQLWIQKKYCFTKNKTIKLESLKMTSKRQPKRRWTRSELAYLSWGQSEQLRATTFFGAWPVLLSPNALYHSILKWFSTTSKILRRLRLGKFIMLAGKSSTTFDLILIILTL